MGWLAIKRNNNDKVKTHPLIISESLYELWHKKRDPLRRIGLQNSKNIGHDTRMPLKRRSKKIKSLRNGTSSPMWQLLQYYWVFFNCFWSNKKWQGFRYWAQFQYVQLHLIFHGLSDQNIWYTAQKSLNWCRKLMWKLKRWVEIIWNE